MNCLPNCSDCSLVIVLLLKLIFQRINLPKDSIEAYVPLRMAYIHKIVTCTFDYSAFVCHFTHISSKQIARSHLPAFLSRSEQGQAENGRPDVDVTTPEGLLLTLISQYPGAAKPAVILMMLEAQAASAKVSACICPIPAQGQANKLEQCPLRSAMPSLHPSYMGLLSRLTASRSVQVAWCGDCCVCH